MRPVCKFHIKICQLSKLVETKYCPFGVTQVDEMPPECPGYTEYSLPSETLKRRNRPCPPRTIRELSVDNAATSGRSAMGMSQVRTTAPDSVFRIISWSSLGSLPDSSTISRLE